MEPEPDRPQRSRDNTLGVALVLLAGGMILFYLYLISLGIVGNVLAAGAVFVVLGALHYLVWGKSFSAEVAAEREALRRPDEKEAKLRMADPSEAIQDLTRTHGIRKNG